MPRFTIREYWDRVAARVRWLREHYAERFGGAIALGFDTIYQGVEIGATSGWLQSPNSPPDALPVIGRERQLLRAPSETNVEYRARLQVAWDIWADAGQKGDGGTSESSFAFRALAPFGVPESDVEVHYEPDSDWTGPNEDNWSLAWVRITDTTPWSLWEVGTLTTEYGVPTIGDTRRTVGSTATRDEVTLARAATNRLKAGHELVVDIILDPNDKMIGSAGATVSSSWTIGSELCRWHASQFVGDWGPLAVVGGTSPITSGTAAIIHGKL
ncbi:MAG: hypothetical protein GVY18_09015 [Bacteroidetes bacterium]|jgi:hypothetical protein|nr:hypothetical protein [Bacteroidota bacterium]